MKYINFIGMLFVFGFIFYAYHMQVNGHQHERIECWKESGILWHTISGDLICIKAGVK